MKTEFKTFLFCYFVYAVIRLTCTENFFDEWYLPTIMYGGLVALWIMQISLALKDAEYISDRLLLKVINTIILLPYAIFNKEAKGTIKLFWDI